MATLRRKLIYAALALLERDGLERLSLRGVARAAGVSAMAPYHHFADRRAMLAAVAARGLERLYAAQMIAVRQTPDPRARAAAAAEALVRYAALFPELFRLIGSAELARPGVEERLDAAHARIAAHFAALLGPRGPLLHALAQGLAAQAIAGALPIERARALAREGAALLAPSA
ncbi:MAG: hypothetical protein A4S12_04950 [Proteobacteria bacterium SG_bin5]|nr:MAG: hypothetical protein A4S12_04950 [Proteobacteria bacterium SG_bin5]